MYLLKPLSLQIKWNLTSRRNKIPHQNYVNERGEAYPSATELTNLLPKSFLWPWYKSQVKKYGWRGWQKCKATSERGMRIGTMVHEYLECLMLKKPYVPHCPEKYRVPEIADAIWKVYEPTLDEVVATEHHGVSNNLRLAGTSDVITRVKGWTGLSIDDFKTSYEKDISHPIQLAIYALCWNEQHPDQFIDQGRIIRVDKKSKKLNVRIDEYRGLKDFFVIVKALRELYDYVNGVGSWQKPEEEI